MNKFVIGLIVIALMTCNLAQAAPVLYRGEMVVRKVSGKACKTEDIGKVRKMELVFDRGTDGTLNGYFTGEMMTGRISGRDTVQLTVFYPFADKELAEGHTLSLHIVGSSVTGSLQEKHLADTVDNCNFDDAELNLSISPNDAVLFLRKAEAGFSAVAVREQGMVLYRQKKYAEAIPLYEKALAMREEAEGKTAEAVSRYLNGLVRVYGNAGRFDDAQNLLTEGLKRFPDGDAHKAMAETRDWLNNLAEAKAADRFFEQAQELEKKYYYAEAIPLYLKALEIDRRIRTKDAAAGLMRLANCCKEQQQWQQAEAYYQELITIIEKEYGKESKELATSLNNLAGLYQSMGQYSRAEPLYLRALGISEKANGPEHPATGIRLNNLAGLYDSLGQYSRAEPLYVRALAISEKANGPEHPATGTHLNNLAGLYQSMGQYSRAEPLYLRALANSEKVEGPEHLFTGIKLNNLAELYRCMGQYSRAEPLYLRALAISEKANGPEHPATGTHLNNLASLYKTLGQHSRAEPLNLRALAISEKTNGPEHPSTGTKLNNLAELYRYMGQFSRAEPLYLRALAISEKAEGPEHPSTGSRLNNLAGLFISMGQYSRAEPLYVRALAISEKAEGPEHPSTGTHLNNLAGLYESMGQYSRAEPLNVRALAIASKAGDPELLYTAQGNFSFLLEKQNHPEAAIFFAKQSVNTIQGLRQNVADLGKDPLKSFDDTVEGAYRHLSRLLVAQGRLPEAERVLELLKEQEQFQFVRRNTTVATTPGRAPMTSFETTQDRLLQEAGAPLAALSSELSALQEKKLRTPEEEQSITQLTAQIKSAGKAFEQALHKVIAALSATRADKVVEVKEAQGLQDTLRELGEGTVALYTVADKQGYSVILTTPDYRRAYSSSITATVLAEKISTYRSLLTNPNLDPRPLGKELLDIILPADARKELAQANATTLMWHLDGPLRYLPLAALYDGSHYLVELYRISLFTSASYPNIKDQPKATWKGLGLGVSESRTVVDKSFTALSSVPSELNAVIRQDNNKGVIPGQQYLNNDFTWETMQQSLKKKGTYPLVHIASHFSLEPGNDTQSFLLPGKGDPITLALISQQNNLFGGVDLVTLSACETAYSGGKNADGKEVDGLSVLAQRQGAKAVIATLWPVADASTALLMQQFYKLREEQKLSKGEALRQAQLTLLNGKVRGTTEDQKRAAKISLGTKGKPNAAAQPFTYNSEKPYAHPYYWAPFILMGNWK